MNDACRSRRRRIRVVLIHHGIAARVAEARPTVELVASAMGTFGDVEVKEVWRQPELAPRASRELAARRLRQWALERQWASYLGVGRRWFLSSGLIALRLLQLLLPRERRRYGRQAFVELALTAKHDLAWRLAFEDGVDLLVILEDDARADESSANRIRRLVEIAEQEQALPRSFIDLAGGVSPKELRLAAVEEPRGDGIVSLHRASTNTTCAYALGQEVVAGLAGHVLRRPGDLSLPADWLINRFFMESVREPRETQTLCLHSRPHALVHGSATGAVSSSIR